jgi:hypothetical protein
MRKALLAGVLSGLGCAAMAQSGLTYYKDIEPILLNNCSGCHKEDGIAPFPLLSYDDVKKRGDFLVKVTKTRYMPPWKADPTFQTYKNELILPDSTLATIENWVKAGMPRGKKVTHAAPLAHPENLARPDLSVKMLRPHKLSATGLEDFRYFVIPTNLPEHTWISSIEFVPGNKRAVHHTRIMVDTTQMMRSMDGISARDPLVAEYQKIPILEEFLYGWAPGNTPIFFPPGTAKLLPRGTDFILNVHYSPSARVQEDQSTINVYFARTPSNREILTLTLREADISNQPFFIPAGTTPSFFFSVPVKKDISVISVLPHMHYLGKNFRAFAVTPSGEVINLIRINSWDFRWQTMYQFKKMLHIPAGSVIVAEAMFDNTADNPDNPTSPPKDVGFGWNTTDEMCNLVMYFLEYQEGDEEIEY